MGCFPACFTSSFTSKRRKRHTSDRSPKTTEALQPIESEKRENIGELIKLIRESKENVEEQVNCAAKKRVTFDLNLKSCDDSSAKEVACDLVEGTEEKRSGNEDKQTEPFLDTITSSKVVSFNPNNRYQDCRKSTDESEDLGLDDIDLEEEEEDSHDDDDKGVMAQEESSESLFSLSIDSRKQVRDAEKGENEVNSPMPIHSFSNEEVKIKTPGSFRNAEKRFHFGDSVLNSIENFTLWKEVKERTVSTLVKHQEKGNISIEQDASILICPEPGLKRANRCLKTNSIEMNHAAEQEIGVDTSLSSWLVGPEMTLESNACDHNSVGNTESEKEKELKQFSASSSSTRSRSHCPDSTPVIGTVGSYWVHTGQNMDSDSSSSGKRTSIAEREKIRDQPVSCNSTTFDARQSRALDTGVC